MERLTEKNYRAKNYYIKCSETCEADLNCVDCSALDKLVSRLGSCEDTGLTPEQCKVAAEMEDALIDEYFSWGRMRELIKADKEGRVVVYDTREEAEEALRRRGGDGCHDME